MLCDFYVSQKAPLNIFPQGPHKEENLRSLLRQLMPALLRLACGSDLVAKQLFHLLVMQLMHWLSSRIMLATPQTEVALLAVWVRHLFYLILVLLSTFGPNWAMQNIPLNHFDRFACECRKKRPKMTSQLTIDVHQKLPSILIA